MSLLGDFNYAVCQNCFTKQELKGLNCLKCGYKLPNEVPYPPGISEERKARMMAVIAGVNKRPPIAGLASKTGPPRAKGGGGKDGSVLLSQSAPLLPLGGASASGGHRVGMMPSGPPPAGPGSPEGKREDAPPRVRSAAAAEAGLGLSDEGEGPAALRSTSAQGGPRLPGIGSPGAGAAGAAGKAKKSRTHADEAAAKQASSTR